MERMSIDSEAPRPPRPPPYSQGVGTVFQFAGAVVFIVMMFVCCASGLFSRESATRTSLNNVGWGRTFDDKPVYSAQLATAISVPAGAVAGLGLSAVGLGLQAGNRRAAVMAVALCSLMGIFLLVNTIFFAVTVRSIGLTGLSFFGACIFCTLDALAFAAALELHRFPASDDFDMAFEPLDGPSSQDEAASPDAELQHELAYRRRRLQVQQKELEELERRLKRRRESRDQPPEPPKAV
jgi:hypothetical protein